MSMPEILYSSSVQLALTTLQLSDLFTDLQTGRWSRIQLISLTNLLPLFLFIDFTYLPKIYPFSRKIYPGKVASHQVGIVTFFKYHKR